MGEAVESDRHSLPAAVAALVRVPNLFTAPPDVILGAALAAAAGATVDRSVTVDPLAITGLAVASMLLYAGGTTLNDAFDAPQDAVERPERPIPSGEISRQTAVGLGAAFLLLGIAVAVVVTGRSGGLIATLTGAGILLYDGVLKGTAVGFATMGAVRGLNVFLGTTVGGGVLSLRWYLPAVAVALFVAAVTFMAERETQGENRFAVAAAVAGAVLAVVAVASHLALVDPGIVAAGVGVALAVGFLAWTGPSLRDAYLDPVPETVGPAVGRCVLGIVVLDAAFAAATGAVWAVAAIAFLVPAVGLSRAFEVT